MNRSSLSLRDSHNGILLTSNIFAVLASAHEVGRIKEATVSDGSLWKRDLFHAYNLSFLLSSAQLQRRANCIDTSEDLII